MEPSDELKAACSQYLKRFTTNYHREFSRDPKQKQEEIRPYRVWILKRCSTEASIAAVIEAAMEKYRRRPTIAELAEIFEGLAPSPASKTWAPVLTPEEQAQRAEMMRIRRAQELQEAEERRRKFLEAREKKPRPPATPSPPTKPQELKRITAADFEALEKQKAAAAKNATAAEDSSQ